MNFMKYLILFIGIILTAVVIVTAWKTQSEVEALELRAKQSKHDRDESLANYIIATSEKNLAEMNKFVADAEKTIEEINIEDPRIKEIKDEVRLRRIVKEAIRQSR